jgi:hypothetical protein
MAVCAANCGGASKLKYIAVVWKSTWMFDEGESRERIRRSQHASVKKQMAQTRMAKSAREEELSRSA